MFILRRIQEGGKQAYERNHHHNIGRIRRVAVTFEEYTHIIIKDTKARLIVRLAWGNSSVEAWGNSSVEAWGNSSVVARGNSSVVARGNTSVVAWENSSVVAWGNSSVVAWENSSVVARGNSSVEAWGNSSVEAWGNSSVVAWENSSVVAWGNSSVEAWEDSSVVAWGDSSVVARENSVVRIFSEYVKEVALYGFAVAIISSAITVNIEKSLSTATSKSLETWKLVRERNAVKKRLETVILYKRVSRDWKTQENTANETLWLVGSHVTHPQMESQKCGVR